MCVKPIVKKNKEMGVGRNEYSTPVPCGKCPECVRAKCNSWLFRINKELEIVTNPLFVLLTYNKENLPRTEEGIPTLVKKDVQDWLKRLRFHYEKISNKQIRYYLVGEYGSKKGRPHYHVILMNLDNPELIEKTWGKGKISRPKLRLGENNKGVRYTLKYISKPQTSGIKRQKEFPLMSKGIGKNYLTKAMVKWHNSRIENCFISTLDGHKIPIPKYYKEKIYDEEKRHLVSHYLQERTDLNKEKAIKEIMQKDNRKSYEEAQKVLEIRKNHSKFEKRNESL